MNLKRIFKSKKLRISPAKYIKYRWMDFIERQYRKNFRTITARKIIQRTLLCPECARKGKCVECGCSFEGMVLTDKKCKRYNPNV